VFPSTWGTCVGGSIFTIDVHPDGTRFATGGQGFRYFNRKKFFSFVCVFFSRLFHTVLRFSDARVRIWSVAPVRNEKDPSPRLLCTLVNHQAAVNSVRWSPNGKYLASASDDKTILIWELRSDRGGVVFGTNERFVENWGCVRALRGHESGTSSPLFLSLFLSTLFLFTCLHFRCVGYLLVSGLNKNCFVRSR
jgi:protein HIRA/HIR1